MLWAPRTMNAVRSPTSTTNCRTSNQVVRCQATARRPGWGRGFISSIAVSIIVHENLPMTAYSCADILAGRAPPDAPVSLCGWVRTRRDSKAGISFVHVSDGSSFHPVQVVAPNTLANYASEVLHLTAGCAVEATGVIVPS